jgi:hypothetical protein
MSDAAEFYGWIRRNGWVRLVGPCPSLDAAARALDAELARRGIKRQRSRNQCVTRGPAPPRDDPAPRTST